MSDTESILYLIKQIQVLGKYAEVNRIENPSNEGELRFNYSLSGRKYGHADFVLNTKTGNAIIELYSDDCPGSYLFDRVIPSHDEIKNFLNRIESDLRTMAFKKAINNIILEEKQKLEEFLLKDRKKLEERASVLLDSYLEKVI